MNKKYALIIGNTEYTDPGLAQLTAPGKDAEDFGRILEDQEICGFDEVNVLLNQTDYIVRGAVDEFFDEKKPDDLLVLYFSGHGVRDEVGSLYLAVKNTVRRRLRSTAIQSDYVREAMEHSRSKRQVLILDCCNSGAFSQGTKAATGVSIGTASAFEAGYGRIILTASDSTQYAWEGDKVIGETSNSLFTHFLVEGLKGDADQDGDGRITVDELYDYAYEKVRIATSNQTPSKFSTKQQGEIVLRRNIPVENIRPAPLPDDLIAAINSSLPYIREGAVRQLEELLKGKNIALARSARAALETVAEQDDSRQTARLAQKAIESFLKIEQLAHQKPEADRTVKEEADRLAAQKAEEKLLTKATAEAKRQWKEEADWLAAQNAENERERVAKAKAEAARKVRAAEKRVAKEEADRIAAQKVEERQRESVKAEASFQPKAAASHPKPEENWLEGRWKWGLAGFILGVLVISLGAPSTEWSPIEQVLGVLAFTVMGFFARL